MKIFGLAGWSGSGKTTLIVKLIPLIIGKGLTVSTIKHAHHAFDIDRPGKDSFEHRQSGAREVLISSANRWALMHELPQEGEPPLSELIKRMSTVDLLLVEGFKWEPHPKIEVYRSSLGKPLLQPDDKNIIAVACDEMLNNIKVPQLQLSSEIEIAEFILTTLQIPTRVP